MGELTRTDRETDAQLAELLGWRAIRWEADIPEQGCLIGLDPTGWTHAIPYFEDIAAAWRLVEHFDRQDTWLSLDRSSPPWGGGPWIARLHGGGVFVSAHGDTAALAIGAAALAAREAS